MEPTRFDRVARLFAERRLSRRRAIQRGATGLAAGVAATAAFEGEAPAQDATPASDPGGDQKVAYLFLQSFQAGAITPKEGEAGRFTLTLESGLGQTIYFSDRPLRDVGATPTPDFLANLGFPADNPPNAALLVEEGGAVNVAVVELFDPRYDAETRTATYDVVPLADFARAADGSFAEAPEDLSAVPSTFGAAHLFIDDCADDTIVCRTSNGAGSPAGGFSTQGFCWNYSQCVPCHPYGHANPYNGAAWDWWTGECNRSYSDCNDTCTAGSGSWSN